MVKIDITLTKTEATLVMGSRINIPNLKLSTEFVEQDEVVKPGNCDIILCLAPAVPYGPLVSSPCRGLIKNYLTNSLRQERL